MKVLFFNILLYFMATDQKVWTLKPQNEVQFGLFIRQMLDIYESNALTIIFNTEIHPQKKIIRLQNIMRQNKSLTISCLSDKLDLNWSQIKHQSSLLVLFVRKSSIVIPFLSRMIIEQSPKMPILVDGIGQIRIINANFIPKLYSLEANLL